MREQGTDGQITCVKMYVNYSPIIPNDNIELNICDYYDMDYTLKIDQEKIEQEKGFEGTLTVTIKDLDEIVEMPVDWYSSDTTVVQIDENGNYKIIGEVGDKATITCAMQANKDIKDSIEIEVVSVITDNKVIVVNPNNISTLKENQVVSFICNVYNQGEMLVDVVTCTPSGAKNECYELTQSINGYILTIKKKSTKDLKLTFSADDCEDYIMNIKLTGLL